MGPLAVTEQARFGRLTAPVGLAVGSFDGARIPARLRGNGAWSARRRWAVARRKGRILAGTVEFKPADLLGRARRASADAEAVYPPGHASPRTRERDW